ncbi:aspartate kinase [Thermococcus waiotapuensis]|uniref:Aspartate kinase n=1 Tax=Thermococcus waiotapuensis TaxID=90909 RepID=A0AAE4NUA0_9EURY|nr:aspartate kinase [Thermococcus waiotapuensis]MDV3103234.1 aspartate kinase [Thermococcus waiotapuensis]
MLYPGWTLVVKFGGTSVRDDFRDAVSFVSRLSDENEVIVVVSALKGVTDALIDLASGKGNLAEIVSFHIDFIRRHNLPLEPFRGVFEELKDVLGRRDEFPSEEAFRDQVLSFGEWISGIAFTEALKREGISVELFEPWEIIATTGDFGNARVNIVETSRRVFPLKRALREGKIAVVPGFVGGFKGYRTTLGRNGSDYTATVLGKALDAKAVLIMREVDGIYTADPGRVPSARLIPFLSYDKLYLAAKAGMRAIHPGAVDVAKGTPLIFGRTRDWNVGTVVGYESSSLPIIAHRVVGDTAEITVIGTTEVPGFETETGSERGIPWARLRVPTARLGSTLNRIHWLIVERNTPRPRTLSLLSAPMGEGCLTAFRGDVDEGAGSRNGGQLWARI